MTRFQAVPAIRPSAPGPIMSDARPILRGLIAIVVAAIAAVVVFLLILGSF